MNDLIAAAVDAEKADRADIVNSLRGEAGSAILQWPGRWSGSREILVIIHDLTRVCNASIGCLLIGKSSSCSCFEHPHSQARWGCNEKRKLKLLLSIEEAVAIDTTGEQRDDNSIDDDNDDLPDKASSLLIRQSWTCCCFYP